MEYTKNQEINKRQPRGNEMNNFKIVKINSDTYQILRASVDEWGELNGGWFVYDVAETLEEAKAKAK